MGHWQPYRRGRCRLATPLRSSVALPVGFYFIFKGLGVPVCDRRVLSAFAYAPVPRTSPLARRREGFSLVEGMGRVTLHQLARRTCRMKSFHTVWFTNVTGTLLPEPFLENGVLLSRFYSVQ